MDLLQLPSVSDPPKVVTVTVSCDASSVDVVLEELGQLYLDEPLTVDPIDRFPETGLLSVEELGQLVRLELDDDPTLGAGKLRILLKPTDSFLQLVAALRARHIDRDVSIN
jgi:hypothetical protein